MLGPIAFRHLYGRFHATPADENAYAAPLVEIKVETWPAEVAPNAPLLLPTAEESKHSMSQIAFIPEGTHAKSFRSEWAKWSTINVAIGDGLFTLLKMYAPDALAAVSKFLGTSIPAVGFGAPIILGLIKAAIVMKCSQKASDKEIEVALTQQLMDIEAQIESKMHSKTTKTWSCAFLASAIPELVANIIKVAGNEQLAEEIMKYVALNPFAVVLKPLIFAGIAAKAFKVGEERQVTFSLAPTP